MKAAEEGEVVEHDDARLLEREDDLVRAVGGDFVDVAEVGRVGHVLGRGDGRA
jgi:hypothetical protein